MQESLADIDLPAPMERDAAERYKDELRSYVQGFYRFAICTYIARLLSIRSNAISL